MLSKKLKEFRQQNGLTQKDLAARLFVSRSAVAKWEQGKGIPSKDDLLNEDEAVIIIENVNKSSKKKVLICLFISLVLLAGIIVATVFAVNTRIKGTVIATSVSPDSQITLTVYNKPQPSNQNKRGYTVKLTGKYKGLWVKEDCRFIGLYWSGDSRYVIEEFYSEEIKKRCYEYTDFMTNRGVNLQAILNEKIRAYYTIREENPDIDFEFIRWDNETDLMLFYFDLSCQTSCISGYFWSTPSLSEPLQGLVEIKKTEKTIG